MENGIKPKYVFYDEMEDKTDYGPVEVTETIWRNDTRTVELNEIHLKKGWFGRKVKQKKEEGKWAKIKRKFWGRTEYRFREYVPLSALEVNHSSLELIKESRKDSWMRSLRTRKKERQNNLKTSDSFPKVSIPIPNTIKEILGEGHFKQQVRVSRSVNKGQPVKEADLLVKHLHYIPLESIQETNNTLLPYDILSLLLKMQNIQKLFLNNFNQHFKNLYEKSFPMRTFQGKWTFDPDLWQGTEEKDKKEIARCQAFSLLLDTKYRIEEKDWKDTIPHQEISEFLRKYLNKNRIGTPVVIKEVKLEDIFLPTQYLRKKIQKKINKKIHNLIEVLYPSKNKYDEILQADLKSVKKIKQILSETLDPLHQVLLKEHLEFLLDLQCINCQDVIQVNDNEQKHVYQVLPIRLTFTAGNGEVVYNTRLFSPRLKVKVMLDVARALRFLTKLEVAHLDISCRNVVGTILGNDLLFQTIDFDQIADEEREYDKSVGAIHWIAPEIIRASISGRRITRKTDVWSFGILCREVLGDTRNLYPGMSNVQVIGYAGVKNKNLQEINRLDIERQFQKIMPDEKLSQGGKQIKQDSVNLLKKCFDYKPQERPDYDRIVDQLTLLYDELSKA